jgi:hypothetical protein
MKADFKPEEIIKFSFNWNYKLDCGAFTTIRLHNPSKYVVGKLYGIELKGSLQKHPARILDIRTLYLKDMNEWMTQLDMGYGLDQGRETIRTMYKNVVRGNIEQTRFDFMLLRYDRQQYAGHQMTLEEFREAFV